MASHKNDNDDGDALDRLETITPSSSSYLADAEDIPGLPSLPSSTSETEEERRKILEGIFAEDDEDEVDEFWRQDPQQEQQQDEAQQQQEQQEEELQDEEGEAEGEGEGDDDGDNIIDTGDEAADDDEDFDAAAPPPPPEDFFSPTHSTPSQRHEFIPDEALVAAAAAAQHKENAYFSSSSDDDDDDGDYADDYFNAVASPAPPPPSIEVIEDAAEHPATTPRFANTSQLSPRQQQQPGLTDEAIKSYDSTNVQFSWIHSADSGDNNYNNEAEVKGQPTLSMQVSEDTASLAYRATAMAVNNNAAATTMNNAVNPVGSIRPSGSRDSSPSSFQQRQHHPPQSAFDRALNEVQQQQQGNNSHTKPRSSSFSFSNVNSNEEETTPADNATTGEAGEETATDATLSQVGSGGTSACCDDGCDAQGVMTRLKDETSPSNGSNSDEASQEEADMTMSTVNLSKNDIDEKDIDDNDVATEETDEDDFFVKAEHTVLDEILSENLNAAEEEELVASKTASPRGDSSPASSQQYNKTSASSKHTPSTSNTRIKDRISLHTNSSSSNNNNSSSSHTQGLPDVLNSMRQKIESFNIFDADRISAGVSKSSISAPTDHYPPSLSNPNSNVSTTNMLMMDTTNSSSSTAPATLQKYYNSEEERESMRRAFQQSISAAVLVSLAHKRYERRRLAAMEIEKVVRSLVVQEDYSRVRAILLLLSDDYVRSTNEDARKGGAVALAACAIGLKKANEGRRDVTECRDLILASVVHACQDHSQRVRYYATESLFNVTKVIPSLAVQHFFILFEILRSLYADVDLDVRSGAELLDKKLKEVIVGAINSGSFSADACVPVFARFVYMRNKATKQLTLTWLKEFSEKLVGAPILEFLHLFLGGIFAMVADPNATIRQLALEFLQSVLPRLLVNNEDFEDAQQKVDFDKILQSLVLTMEHPDPFVRKVSMFWMSRIVQAHMSSAFPTSNNELHLNNRDVDHPDNATSLGGGVERGGIDLSISADGRGRSSHLTAASISVRNALPHVLPGILLSIGDTHQSRAKDSFLPDQTTHSLAEQANTCLQDAVRRDGQAFIPHLGGFIVALREELDSPGGLIARNPPSVERRPYRMDVKADGSGIESTGWFRASDGVEERDNALILSRLCALQWVVVLYEHVVPNSLKADYASEFIDCIIYQLVDQPPGIIIVKSFEVLAKISNPAEGEESYTLLSSKSLVDEDAAVSDEVDIPSRQNMDEENANFALEILEPSRHRLLSRDRGVFASLIDLHSKHQKLLMDISKVIELMCTLQPPEFVFVSFAYELDSFIVSRMKRREKLLESPEVDTQTVKQELASFAKDLAFVSNFAQQLGIVFFAAPETEQLREVLKDSIGFKGETVRDERRARLFHILLYTFSHNIVATLAFCLWGGAFLTASTFLQKIDCLDVSLMFYLEIDQLIDLIERPLFRHLHLRMLECEDDPYQEGSGAMLFRTLKSIMMLLPQSTSYMILKERLASTARYRQSAVALSGLSKHIDPGSETDVFVKRIVNVRRLHCDAKWRNIRAESLEEPCRIVDEDQKLTAAQQRREWLGYADEEEELATREKLKQNLLGETPKKAEMIGVYEKLNEMETPILSQYKNENNEECEQGLTSPTTKGLIKRFERMSAGDEEEDRTKPQWREYWASRQ